MWAQKQCGLCTRGIFRHYVPVNISPISLRARTIVISPQIRMQPFMAKSHSPAQVFHWKPLFGFCSRWTSADPGFQNFMPRGRWPAQNCEKRVSLKSVSVRVPPNSSPSVHMHWTKAEGKAMKKMMARLAPKTKVKQPHQVMNDLRRACCGHSVTAPVHDIRALSFPSQAQDMTWASLGKLHVDQKTRC